MPALGGDAGGGGGEGGGAEGEANGYLAKRYQVPVDLSAHPDLSGVLKSMVLDIAVWRLFNRRPPADKPYLDSRDQAIEWFRMVSEGKIPLPSVPPVPSTTSEDPVAGWGANVPTMQELQGL